MSSLYPQNVDPKQEDVDSLIGFFKDSYKKVVDEILNSKSFSVKRRKEILKQIEDILNDLGVDIDKFIKSEIPKYYEMGASDAIKQLKNTKIISNN